MMMGLLLQSKSSMSQFMSSRLLILRLDSDLNYFIIESLRTSAERCDLIPKSKTGLINLNELFLLYIKIVEDRSVRRRVMKS